MGVKRHRCSDEYTPIAEQRRKLRVRTDSAVAPIPGHYCGQDDGHAPILLYFPLPYSNSTSTVLTLSVFGYVKRHRCSDEYTPIAEQRWKLRVWTDSEVAPIPGHHCGQGDGHACILLYPTLTLTLLPLY